MYNYELFEIEDGYGYDIIQNDNIIIHQEYEPSKSGFEIMTEEQAIENALIIIKRLEG